MVDTGRLIGNKRTPNHEIIPLKEPKFKRSVDDGIADPAADVTRNYETNYLPPSLNNNTKSLLRAQKKTRSGGELGMK